MVKKLINKTGDVFGNIALAVRSLFWKRQRDTVVFGAWFGDRFADNSRYLFQYLSEHKEALGLRQVVWITRSEKVLNTLREMGYQVCLTDSPEALQLHKTAFMHILCNSASDKKGSVPDFPIAYSYGAIRVNLWHGVGVVKGVGCASLEYKKRKAQRRVLYGLKEALEKLRLYRRFVAGRGGWGDFYFLTTTPAATKQFAEFSYIPPENFIHSQYPRTCPAPRYTPEEARILEHIRRYPYTVLYAPTFRTGENSFDFSQVATPLQEVLETENILWLQKAHSASATALTDTKQAHILNLPPDFDLNVLMDRITLLVTDYSSAASDARFFRKPVLFFVPDLEQYMNGDNGVTEEAEELLHGPKCNDIPSLKQALRQYVRDPESAKPSDFEALRTKYWGEEKDLAQIWQDILTQTEGRS